ncbi:MAG: 3-deoxy-D-manno-octulosonic acid transferase, partial [Fidelibacterota bacterium]
PWSAWIFFKLIKPKYYIITRHDIWPNHVFIAKQLKIQVILINANLHDNSHRLKPMARNANRWIFSKFDKIFTGSERLKKNLINLAMEDKIYVTGDTRFDQVLERRNLNTTRLLPDSFSTSINLIFGSVIASDLEIISETITQYLPEGNSSLVEKNYRLIVVPHETDEETIKLWEDMFKQKNIPSIRYSDADHISNSRAVIVDTVGKLADLYKYGDISYVGAGFGAGVHSVIEPAVYGCVVIFGPNIHILDEAVEMHTEKIAYMVKTFDDFVSLLMMFENQDQLKLCQKKTLHYVKSHPLSSMRIISHIFNDEQN